MVVIYFVADLNLSCIHFQGQSFASLTAANVKGIMLSGNELLEDRIFVTKLSWSVFCLKGPPNTIMPHVWEPLYKKLRPWIWGTIGSGHKVGFLKTGFLRFIWTVSGCWDFYQNQHRNYIFWMWCCLMQQDLLCPELWRYHSVLVGRKKIWDENINIFYYEIRSCNVI